MARGVGGGGARVGVNCEGVLPWRKGARLEKNYGLPSVRIKQKIQSHSQRSHHMTC